MSFTLSCAAPRMIYRCGWTCCTSIAKWAPDRSWPHCASLLETMLQRSSDPKASHSQSLTLFMSTLTSKRMEHIEFHLGQIVSEAQSGTRDFELQVQSESDTIIGLDETQWEMLQTELLNDGFVEEDIVSHKLWFEERLRKVDKTPFISPPTPPKPKKPHEHHKAQELQGPKASMWRLRSKDPRIDIGNNRYLSCRSGDAFVFLSIARIRPGRSDLWRCLHVDSWTEVVLEASLLEPEGRYHHICSPIRWVLMKLGLHAKGERNLECTLSPDFNPKSLL